MHRVAVRRAAVPLTLVGAISGVVAAAVAFAAREQAAVPAIGLAMSFFVAGWVAARARPDHPEAVLILAAGAAHLAAFGVSAGVGVSTGTGWLHWVGAVVGNLCFNAGLAAVALALALYPTGRPSSRAERVLVRATPAVLAASVLLPALTDPALDLAVQFGRRSVPAPGPLPFGAAVVDPFPLLPLLVVAGVVLLVRRSRRGLPDQRQQVTWVAGAAGLLALLLLSTPAGVEVLGARAWGAVFVAGAAVVPFALLAGLTRYRLLEVDLYVTRTLAYGGLVVVVLSVYAAAAALIGDRLPLAVSVAAALLAATTGSTVRRVLERAADRVVTGGRLGRTAVLRRLIEDLALPGPDPLDHRAADVVREGLRTAWVRIVLADDHVVASGPESDGAALVSVPLVAGGVAIGELQCGPRHGGWSDADVELLRALGRHVALALENTRLTVALEAQVEELLASRTRLVRAEEQARRRIERDIHDGVQQQLVALLARLEVLRAVLPRGSRHADAASVAHELAQRSLADLRELVRGIHPPLLTDHGLVEAVRAQVALLPVPVSVDVDPRLDAARWALDAEAAAYFVVLEALTNVLKHAAASAVRVVLTPTEDGFSVAVTDDGCGFDDRIPGAGLSGLRDRVDALGGVLRVTSTPGVGTTVVASFPAREAVGA